MSMPSAQAVKMMSSTDAPRDPHLARDQGLAASANGEPVPGSRPAELLEQRYNHPGMLEQQQQYKEGSAVFNHPNAANYPRPYSNGGHAYPTAPATEASHGLFDQQQYQQQQHQLPEDAPAPKTDPVELSLLASYLEVVRKTQGDAAAAEAMAASGADAAAIGNAINSSAAQEASSFGRTADTAEGTWASSAAAAMPASASAAAAAAAEDNLAVNNLLGFIKQRKLTGLPVPPVTGRRSSSGGASTASSTTGGAGGGGAVQQAVNAAGRKVWIQPSGPRRPGEGVENEEQGILSAEEVTATGEVMMRITLLAAGFVIGPSGASVRAIVCVTGADINSWTESAGTHRGRRPARIFVIKGEPRCVAQAIYIITAAVDRYKELCEGRYTGQSVPRAQNVLGVTFSYQPPPKSIVPCAASLKELYAPVNSVAAQARFSGVAPPDLYNTRMPNPRTVRGPSNPYDPSAWTAMMTAAARMGMNPFAALAAAGGNPLGFNPYQNPFGGFNPAAAAGFGAMGGFGAPQNPMAGLGAGGLDPMGAGLGCLGFGMGPLLNPATSAGLLDNTGDMFGGGASLFGATAGLGVGLEGGPTSTDGLGAGFGAGWGSAAGANSMFDPTGMSALMNAGLFGMPPTAAGAAGFDPAAAAAAGGYEQMAAMRAGFDPAAAIPAEGNASFGLLQNHNTAAAAGLGPAAAVMSAQVTTDGESPKDTLASRGMSRANSGSSSRGPAAAPSSRANSGPADDQITSSGFSGANSTAAAVGADTGSGMAHGAGAGWLPVPPPAHALPAPPSRIAGHPRERLPPLHVPAEAPGGSESHMKAAARTSLDGNTTPKSPAAAGTGHAGGGVGGAHGMPYPGPPHSPHVLGPFGPLFHPLSPAAPMMPYGPLPAMPPYAAPSPIRIMRDRSGQPVPYMEVGGTTYFPASPMPPHPAMVHGLFSPARRGPREEQHATSGPDQHGPGSAEDGSGAAGDSAAAAAGSSGEGSSGGSGRQRSNRGRPPSGQTPLRMAGSALRLLEDNPYLVQDTIGSSKSPDSQHQYGGYYSSGGSSTNNSGSGNRQYIRGGARGSPRRGYAASPRQPQGWQPRRNAGSSNSVGPAGIAAASSDKDTAADAAAASGSSAPRFDAAAISAALALPGGRTISSDAAARDSMKHMDVNKGYGHMNEDYGFDSSDGNDSNNRVDDQAAGHSTSDNMPSMRPLLSAIPEAAIAADSSPPRVGIRYGTGSRPAGYSQLGAQDPIVSPGRITLASKVKSARFSAAAHAAATGRSSPGSE